MAQESHPPSTNSVGIFVLGMHRSGTSATTRVCNLLGAHVGSALIESGSDNPAGFWELRSVVQTNEGLLEILGSDYRSIFPLPEKWEQLPEIVAQRAHLSEIITNELSAPTPWVIKDPRLCLLFPLWCSVAREHGISPRCILVIRHPVSVMQSLKKRESLPHGHAALLWLRYNLEAERATRGIPRSWIVYEQMLAEWEVVFQRAAQELQLSWPQKSSSIGIQVQDFLDPTLAHERAAPEDFESIESNRVRGMCRTLFNGLRAGTLQAADFDALREELDEVTSRLKEYLPDYHKTFRDIEKLKSDSNNLKFEHGQLTQQMNEARAYISHVERDINEQRARGDALEQKVYSLQDQIAAMPKVPVQETPIKDPSGVLGRVWRKLATIGKVYS